MPGDGLRHKTWRTTCGSGWVRLALAGVLAAGAIGVLIGPGCAGSRPYGRAASDTGTSSATGAAPSAATAPAAIFRSGVEVDSLIRSGEIHFMHLYQLTNGGENAEAYFSRDGNDLILQATPRGERCDQIYVLPAKGGDLKMVSTGLGRCTCSYFMPGDKEIVFSSTHLGSPDCPPKPDFSKGYVWALYESYDIFMASRDGSNLHRLTDSPGYDAEATVGPDGTIVFTSDRDGDLELYAMKPDGSGVRRLTHSVGYDGGAFFSADGTKICYRASSPRGDAERKDYQDLLAEGLIQPGKLEIAVMDADGQNQVHLTDNGAANFCPFFRPDGRKVIYTSNANDPSKRNFELFLVDILTKQVEQLTFEPTFDGFPMFSPDGGRLVFASNRGAERPGETNIFVAVWAE